MKVNLTNVRLLLKKQDQENNFFFVTFYPLVKINFVKHQRVKTITIPQAVLTLSNEFFVTIAINDYVSLDKKDILEINEAKHQLVGENPYVVVFIPGMFASISSEARSESATANVYKNAIAKAIVVTHIGQRLIGNLFLNFNKPPAPTKLFKTNKDALLWLEQEIIAFQKISKQKKLMASTMSS